MSLEAVEKLLQRLRATENNYDPTYADIADELEAALVAEGQDGRKCICGVAESEHHASLDGHAFAAAPSLHKEEVNMPRDPRDKQESGEHRADSEQTSAFDAKAWLAKEYPDWIADVKEYELELIERAYNSGRAALHKEEAGGEPSPKTQELIDGIAQAINRVSGENGSNTPDFILAEYLVRCLKAFDITSRTREKWYGKSLSIGGSEVAASPAGRAEQVLGSTGAARDGDAP